MNSTNQSTPIQDRRPRRLGLKLSLALTLFAAVPASPILAQDPPPATGASAGSAAATIRVEVERVDPSAFPEVDVYFRVVDTVPHTAYHPLQPGDVTILEGEADGGVAEAEILEDNLVNPEIRPLAVALAIDRSASVAPVLDKLYEATSIFLQGMSDNGELADDTVSLTLFAGEADLSDVWRLPMTADPNAAIAFAQEAMSSPGGNTPLNLSWNLALREASITEDYEARAVLSMTDGWNNPPGSGPNLDSIIQAGISNDVPIFNFAFIEYSENLPVQAYNIFTEGMSLLANETGGAYFEPMPPWDAVPSTPTKPDNTSDPGSLDDTAAVDHLGRLAGVLKDKMYRGELSFEQVRPLMDRIFQPPLSGPGDLAYLDPATDPRILAAAQGLSWDDLDGLTQQVQAATGGGAQQVSEEQLREFYVDQVANMFDKVRSSMKHLYRVRIRSDHDQLDGALRDVRVRVRYTSAAPENPVQLEGEGAGRYVVPVVVEEDTPVDLATSINPNTRLGQLLFGNAPAPRGGTWRGPTQMGWKVELMGPDSLGAPAVLATRDPDGTVTVEDGPDSDFQNLDGDDREALVAYLEHLQLDAQADLSSGHVAVQLTGNIPTCIRDEEDSMKRPVENRQAKDWRKLLWYRIEPQVRRTYDFVVTVPTDGGMPGLPVPSTEDVIERLPALTVYVEDRTPPTLAVYLTPHKDRRINRAELLEAPVDVASDNRLSPVLSGNAWSPDGAIDLVSAVAAAGTTGFPVSLPQGDVEGFNLPEDVRTDIQVLARDNFDRADDVTYLLGADGGVPAHNLYEDRDPHSYEARKGEAPYLPRVRLDDGEALSEMGVTLRLEEDGTARPAPDSLLLRLPNVPDGPDISLVAEARDESGNVSILRIPIKVRALDVRFVRMAYETRRYTRAN